MINKQSQPFLTQSHIFTIAFFVLFLFLLYQMGRLLAPFSAALLWAAIIVLALHPLYLRIGRLLRGRMTGAAAIMTLITLLIIVGPTIALLGVLASQTVDLYQWLSEGIKSGEAMEFWSRISSKLARSLDTLPFFADLDLKNALVSGLRQFSSSLTSQVGVVLRDTLLLVINLFIMLTAIFFLFRNGENYYRAMIDLIPFSGNQKRAIVQKLHETFKAVINGLFLIALGQGIMTGIGFSLFSIPFPVFWGFLASLLALLPVGGAALVWVPGVIYLLLTQATVKGVLLAVWGTLLVSLPDNFLKPLLIGKKAKLPAFFLFFGILGGLQVYGFLGVLLGPLIVTFLTALIQIYREEFAQNETSI